MDKTKHTSEISSSLHSLNSLYEQPAFTLQKSLDIALQYHISGDLSKAEQIYKQMLKTNPDHPDSLHLLGVVSHQLGQSERAVDLIRNNLISLVRHQVRPRIQHFQYLRNP